MFSGAQWRSNPDMADQRQQSWDRTTLLHWRRLLDRQQPAELGLEAQAAVSNRTGGVGVRNES